MCRKLLEKLDEEYSKGECLMRIPQNEITLFVRIIKSGFRKTLIEYNVIDGTREIWVPEQSIVTLVTIGEHGVRMIILCKVKIYDYVFDPMVEFAGSRKPVHHTGGEKIFLEAVKENGTDVLNDMTFTNVVVPKEVNDDGYVHIIGLGKIHHVLGQKLEPPNEQGDAVEVIAMFNSISSDEVCDSCGAEVQLGRCFFITERNFIVHPCIRCDEWVWTQYESQESDDYYLELDDYGYDVYENLPQDIWDRGGDGHEPLF